MVSVNMTKMTTSLAGASVSKDSAVLAAQQVGSTALLAVGNADGIQATVRVTLLGWVPSFGRSRWLVSDSSGQSEVVAAERLQVG